MGKTIRDDPDQVKFGLVARAFLTVFVVAICPHLVIL